MHSPVDTQTIRGAVDAVMSPVADATAAYADPRPIRSAGIVGLGTALPPDAIESDAIGERLGLASGWIERRTGIGSRRRAANTSRVRDLAADAARAALADADVDASDIDMVLVATLA